MAGVFRNPWATMARGLRMPGWYRADPAPQAPGRSVNIPVLRDLGHRGREDSRPSPGTPADGVALGRYFVIWFVIQRAW